MSLLCPSSSPGTSKRPILLDDIDPSAMNEWRAKIEQQVALDEVSVPMCRLCGIVLSSRFVNEAVIHFNKFHAENCYHFYTKWLENRAAKINREAPQNVQMPSHPIWKQVKRITRSKVVCTLCYKSVIGIHCSMILRHFEREHVDVYRQSVLEYQRRCK